MGSPVAPPPRPGRREGDGENAVMLTPQVAPESPPLQSWNPLGPREQEIWLETVGLHRKEDPGDRRLRAKATSCLATAPSS